MIEALAAEMPEVSVSGIAAGVQLAANAPELFPERAIRSEAARRGAQLEFLSDCYLGPAPQVSSMLLGYAQPSEARYMWRGE